MNKNILLNVNPYEINKKVICNDNDFIIINILDGINTDKYISYQSFNQDGKININIDELIRSNPNIINIKEVLSTFIYVDGIFNNKNNQIDVDIHMLSEDEIFTINKFVEVTVTGDLYNKLKYEYDMLKLGYKKYTYDNIVYKVIIDKHILKNFIYDDCRIDNIPMSTKNQLNNLYKNLNSLNSRFNKFKEEYFKVSGKNKIKEQYLIRGGNGLKRAISKKEEQIKDLKYNILPYKTVRDYIVNNKQIYYNEIKNLKNLCYKSFKSESDFIDFKYEVDSIILKESNFKTAEFIRQNDSYDYYYKNIIYNNNTNNDEVYTYCLNDLNNMYRVLEKMEKVYNKSLDTIKNSNKENFNTVFNSIKENKYLFDNLINELSKRYLINPNLKYKLGFVLNEINDCYAIIEDLREKNNNQYDDYDIYTEDIFKSRMNHHNSIFKNSQSEFLRIAYNSDRSDFTTLE